MAGLGAAVALLAFGWRFLGFKGPANDQYMHLAWAQQMLFGEIPGRDFVEPGMPLAVALSALVQLGWRGPLSEGILSIAMLAAAAGVTAYLTTSLSRSVTVGFVAATLQVAFGPRLYSYPKILVPAVALLLLARYAQRPSTPRLAGLAAWTVTAFLFRHDLGLVAATATTVGILLVHAVDWRSAVRAAGTFMAIGLVCVTPYLVLVGWTEGIAEHVRAGIEFGKSDTHQLLWFETPSFPFLASGGATAWTIDDATALLFWAIHGTLLATAATLAVRWRHLDPTERPVIAAALMFLLFYRIYVLRHALEARLPDLAAVLVIPAAWTVAEIGRLARARLPARPAVALGLSLSAAALTAATVAGTLTLRDIGDDFGQTNASRGWRGMRARAVQVVLDGQSPFWPRYWPAGDVPEAVSYLATCTAPSDRVLLTWPAPEYYFFAGRGFAAGHAWFLAPHAFVSEQDQRLMLDRLDTQSVPVVLVNEESYAEFSAALPQISAYLERRYETVGEFTLRAGERITIRWNRAVSVSARYKDGSWPCPTTSTPAIPPL